MTIPITAVAVALFVLAWVLVLYCFAQLRELKRLSIAAEGSRRRMADRRNAIRYLCEGRREGDHNA